MPDPRIRRSKPRLPRARQTRADAPDVVEAPASLAPSEAASAEAEAEAEAAASVAVEADEGAGLGVEEAARADVDALPQTDAAADEAAAEPAGWFRDAPLDGGEAAPADADAEPEPERDADAEPTADADAEPDAEPAADAGAQPDATAALETGTETEALVRERDRPVVTSEPGVAAPPRKGRLRGVLIGLATIAIVAAAGFVAGLMLPTLLPGPGIASESPSPSVVATPAATATGRPTTEPSIAPSATPSPQPTPEPTPAPTQVVYVVKSGDQLSRIAKKYGVTVAAIQAANSIKDPNLIRVGQKLIIPLPVVSPAP